MPPTDLPAELKEAVQHLAAGRIAAARDACERVLEKRPDDAETLHISALVLFRLGEGVDAIDRLVRALERQPDSVDMLANLGQMQFERGEFEAAADCLAAAADLAPEDPYLRLQLAAALQRLQRHDEAEAVYNEILKRAPNFVPALYDFGHALQSRGRIEEAIARFEAATRADPNDFSARSNAIHLRQVLCDWRGNDRIRAQLIEPALRAFAGGKPATGRPPLPLDMLALPVKVTPAEFRALAGAHARAHSFVAARQFDHPPQASFKPDHRLRIGYVSSDFRDHPVGHIVRHLLHRHDPRSFAVTAYALTRTDGSRERAHFVTELPRFVELAEDDDAAAARRINQDGIDILVDLNGYTSDNRLRIFTRRPAPLQVGWLGFSGTLGSNFIDYLIADPVVAPAAEQASYAERLVHLPHAYIALGADTPPAPPPRASLGLPEKGTVFCAFNAAYKIEPAMFSVWMRLLEKTPGSVLWLRVDNAAALANMRREAEARKVDPARLIAAPRLPHAEHLARMGAADLFLDTLFYGGHATVTDALSAGVPVVTVAGDAFVSRVGASLLRAAGMPELAVADLAAYEALALRLAIDRAALADARARLAAARKTAPLFDPDRFMRGLEAAYRRMWENWLSAMPPQPISIAPN
jgi:predicted O-linked N-acetylglucosamine transferase (SPINDLY family)